MEKVKLLDGRITLIRGDCLEIMPRLKSNIINMVLCDLPYGTTRNKWDSVLPLDTLWKEYKRLRKSNAAVVLTAQTPFDKLLGVSNLEELKYEWIWRKNNATGHLNAKVAPMKEHENVLVFGGKLYNPQGIIPFGKTTRRGGIGTNYNAAGLSNFQEYTNYPKSIIEFKYDGKKVHPTQKPVALMEYLIKTYTNENDLVLDNTMGSGTTAVACINTNRRFVGIERDTDDKGNSLGYFQICIDRCNEAIAKLEERKAAA